MYSRIYRAWEEYSTPDVSDEGHPRLCLLNDQNTVTILEDWIIEGLSTCDMSADHLQNFLDRRKVDDGGSCSSFVRDPFEGSSQGHSQGYP